MPRKKKGVVKKESTTTYHKSKNGRYYKKTQGPDGKKQTRFCSRKEAEGGLAGSGDSGVSKKQKGLKQSDK